MSVLASVLLASSLNTEILVGGWSHHFSGSDVNESHEVVGLCVKDWCGGRYKNSYNNVDVFSYKRIELYSGVVDAGFNVGVMGGYEGNVMMTKIGNSGFVFGASPYVSIGGEKFSIEFNLLPHEKAPVLAALVKFGL